MSTLSLLIIDLILIWCVAFTWKDIRRAHHQLQIQNRRR